MEPRVRIRQGTMAGLWLCASVSLQQIGETTSIPTWDALEKRGQLLASSQRPCVLIRDVERK